MVQLRNKYDVGFLFTELFSKYFSGFFSSFGWAGDKGTYFDVPFEKLFGHLWSIGLSPVIQWTVKVGQAEIPQLLFACRIKNTVFIKLKKREKIPP